MASWMNLNPEGLRSVFGLINAGTTYLVTKAKESEAAAANLRISTANMSEEGMRSKRDYQSVVNRLNMVVAKAERLEQEMRVRGIRGPAPQQAQPSKEPQEVANPSPQHKRHRRHNGPERKPFNPIMGLEGARLDGTDGHHHAGPEGEGAEANQDEATA